MSLKLVITSTVCTCIICGVICSTFVKYGANDNFFLLLPFAISIGVICSLALLLSIREMSNFRFLQSDVLITVGISYYIWRYDYQLHLADWKVYYAVLLLLLWYAARIVFCTPIISKKILSTGVVGVGCILAGWGILQIYSLCNSNHILFHITGPFFNPGPYSGYIAMLLPICLHNLICAKDWQSYVFCGAFVLMLCIIPAAMSRTAWLAICISLLIVLGMHNRWLNFFVIYVKKAPRKAVGSILLLCVVMCLTFEVLYNMNSDSVRGRFFIWKNTCSAIVEKPFIGYGPGSFQMVYGKAQAKYFAAGNGTIEEKRVAGYAEYAFNEYLQLCIEGGIIIFLIIILFGLSVVKQGIFHKQYGYCGALCSLAIFAFSSYPLQILPFGISLIIFSAICVSDDKMKDKTDKNRKSLIKLISFLICFGVGIGIFKLRNLNELSERWYNTNILFNNRVYDKASKSYDLLYSYMNYKPEFLIKYAFSLYSQGNYLKACEILERAKLVSCNSKIWNMQGKYYKAAGYYRTAEYCYEQSLFLAPERIYPYYLLAKLYMESNYYNKEKAKQMANIVMTKSPKIYTKAIDKMREEMSLLLSVYK